MKLTLHVLRHGTRKDFLTKEWTSPTGLPKDPPLADQGHAQAKEVRCRLQEIQFAHCFTSPFSRCLQTIEPYARSTHLKLKVEPGLMEWFSDWDKGSHPPLPPQRPTVEALEPLFPGLIDREYRPLWTHPTRWESQDDVHDRLAWTVNRIVQLVDETQRSTIAGDETHVLLVTHAACQIALGRALLGDRAAEIKCGVASLCRFSRASARDRWTMEANGDADHLAEGLLYNWAFTEDTS